MSAGWVARMAQPPSNATKALLEQAFSAFDKDGNGRLSVAEMMGILTRSGGGRPLSSADAEAIIREFDTDADGQLDLGEFVHAFTGEVGALGLVHVHAMEGGTYNMAASDKGSAVVKGRSFSMLANSQPTEFHKYRSQPSVFTGLNEVQAATTLQAYERGRYARRRYTVHSQSHSLTRSLPPS